MQHYLGWGANDCKLFLLRVITVNEPLLVICYKSPDLHESDQHCKTVSLEMQCIAVYSVECRGLPHAAFTSMNFTLYFTQNTF